MPKIYDYATQRAEAGYEEKVKNQKNPEKFGPYSPQNYSVSLSVRLCTFIINVY